LDSGIYLNAAGALAAEARLDVIANNIANVDTPGFKRSFTLQRARAPEATVPSRAAGGRADLDALGGGLFIQEVRFDASQGGIVPTGEPLDVAIDGDGWFGVELDGETLYTRAGNFQRRADGVLATADGRGTVLDLGGGPIVLPDGGSAPSIDESGQITVDGVLVGRIGVFGTLDPRAFEPAGGSLFRSKEGLLPESEGARLRASMLESSTSDPVREMVRMIQTFRAYETNQRMIALQDQALGRAVNDVGRLG
jgi:flagellar basal-body rod protein FlgF